MAWLSAAEAADRLGVSVQRVHQLLNAGALAGQRPGREWLIDEADLPRVRHQQAGRPLSPTSAWSLAVFVHNDELARQLLSPSDRSRAKSRLRELARLRNHMVHGSESTAFDQSVRELSGSLNQMLRSRAVRQTYRASERDLEDLRTDARVRLAGVSASAAEMAAEDMVEAYVDERHASDVIEDYLLDVAGPGHSNVVLHVVPDEVNELAAAVPPDSWLLLAADLAEHSGPRELTQAVRLLAGLEELDDSGRLSRHHSPHRG